MLVFGCVFSGYFWLSLVFGDLLLIVLVRLSWMRTFRFCFVLGSYLRCGGL